MKVNNILFLCITIIGLFSHNEIHTISDGFKFFTVTAGAVVIGGAVCTAVYKSGAGSKTLEIGLPNFMLGMTQVAVPPAAKLIKDILEKPFLNPIDLKIKELVEQREALGTKLNALQQMAQARTIEPGKKPDAQTAQFLQSTAGFIQSTTMQQLALEKKITKLYEKKEFDKKRSKIIFP